MAINKNFVIKNGVQVNTNLIVGDSTTNRVGVGTTVPGYTLHVGGARGGIGATDLNVTGVGTVKDLLVSGYSGFSSDVSVSGIVSAQSLAIGTTEIVDRGMRLSGIASLDATTTATIEEAIRVGPNSFSDLKVSGISTFVGIASFLGGIDVDVRSGVSTFSAPVQFGISKIDGQAGLSSNYVAVGATVGFGTTAFFRDNAAIFMGDGSDLKIHHDGSNSYIQDVGTGDLIVRGSADIKLQSASSENYLVANDTGSVDIYFDNSKKVETTSGGLKVTGITTLTDRLFVEAGISTFVGDVRFGIGATVGFGTSAFFRDDASIYLGNDLDAKLYHDAGGDTIFRHSKTGTGNDLWIESDTNIILGKTSQAETLAVFAADGSVSIYFDDSKKLETTSGGLNITGVTTFSDRINVVSGISTFQDSAKLTFGAQSDLIVWHDGSHSYIQDTTGTGNLYVDSNSLQVRNAAGNETQATFAENGAVSLYYDNGNVFQTTPQGVNVSGVTTSNRLNISGVSTFTSIGSNLIPDVDGTRNIGAATSEWGDLFLDGTATVDALVADTAKISDLTDNRVVIAGTSGELEDSGNLTFDGSTLAVTGDETVSGKISVGSGVTASANGNIAAAGIVTANGGIVVGTGSSIIIGSAATIFSNGNVTISGIATVGSDLVVLGNLDVTGDITYDEVSGRNLNISGVSTFGSGNGGVSGLLVTGAGYVGGGATVGAHAGIITYYGDGANLTGVTIGIGTTGDGSAGIHPVGYGVTYLEFKGAGFTTAYYDGNLGIATLCFQGGGTSGAAGTWAPYGEAGIATSKSVGVGTIGMGVTSLQGGQKGASSGIGNSFRGLYIGNGMMVVDNTLNGNHYIGTAYNGLMAGPVTINGVLTVDGNYVVV